MSTTAGGNQLLPTAFTSISFPDFEALCDDPRRDECALADVRALLFFDWADGFHLGAQDAGVTYLVTDRDGSCIRFRTIEAAINLLQGVSGLSEDIGLISCS